MNSRIKEQNMEELALYQAELRRKPRLRYLFFELTDKCNLRCQHCGSSCTGQNSTFLEYDVVRQTMKAVKNRYGTADTMICLTGGEPLLHPAIYAVIKDAHDLGFSVGITTNGTLIDNVSARQLFQAGLDTVAVSIDGIGKTHDSFRLVKGCFDRAVFGIHSLKKAGLEPQVITVIHKDNYYQLEELYDFLHREEIYSWRLVNIDPIGRAAENEQLLLDATELRGLFTFIRNKRFDSGNHMEVVYGCSHFVTYDFENEIRDYYFQCGAGTMVASIMANGNIGACLDIERREDLVQGNIYRDDFIDVWENRFQVYRRNRAELSEKCENCIYSSVCMGDSAHTWDYDTDEPRYCVSNMIMEG